MCKCKRYFKIAHDFNVLIIRNGIQDQHHNLVDKLAET